MLGFGQQLILLALACFGELPGKAQEKHHT